MKRPLLGLLRPRVWQGVLALGRFVWARLPDSGHRWLAAVAVRVHGFALKQAQSFANYEHWRERILPTPLVSDSLGPAWGEPLPVIYLPAAITQAAAAEHSLLERLSAVDGDLVIVAQAGVQIYPWAGAHLAGAMTSSASSQIWALMPDCEYRDSHGALRPQFHSAASLCHFDGGAPLPALVAVRKTALYNALSSAGSEDPASFYDFWLWFRAGFAAHHCAHVAGPVACCAGPELLPAPATLPLLSPAPSEALVSIIIPTRDALEHTARCLDSLQRFAAGAPYEVILVDNQSREPAALTDFARRAERGELRLLKYDAPFNYAAINNFAVGHARGEYVLLLNNDTEVTHDGWLATMLATAAQAEVGCVGVKLLYPDGRLQHAGVATGLGQLAGHPYRFEAANTPGSLFELNKFRAVSAVTAACLLVAKVIYEEVGGLDEKAFPVAFNDVDFCLRVWDRGLINVYLPEVTLIHHESVSRGADDSPAKKERFARESQALQSRWATHLKSDPFFHPYLCHVAETATLATAPAVKWGWSKASELRTVYNSVSSQAH